MKRITFYISLIISGALCAQESNMIGLEERRALNAEQFDQTLSLLSNEIVMPFCQRETLTLSARKVQVTPRTYNPTTKKLQFTVKTSDYRAIERHTNLFKTFYKCSRFLIAPGLLFAQDAYLQNFKQGAFKATAALAFGIFSLVRAYQLEGRLQGDQKDLIPGFKKVESNRQRKGDPEVRLEYIESIDKHLYKMFTIPNHIQKRTSKQRIKQRIKFDEADTIESTLDTKLTAHT